jgi:hypothetical protein
MTELVSCPRCGDALDVPAELLGQPVRCASCRTVFTPTPTDAIPTAPRARRLPSPPRLPAFEDVPPAKSNTWVWLVLVLLVGMFGGLSLLCAGWIGTLVNPAMTVHPSNEGRFRVALPVEPTPVSRNDDKGRPVVGLQAHRPQNQETFQAVSAELSAAEKRIDLEDADATEGLLADLARRHLPALAAGTETKREVTTHGKYPALDVLFQQGGGMFKRMTIVRLIVAEGRVYVLSAQGGNLDPHVSYVRRFFTSFEPLPAAK